MSIQVLIVDDQALVRAGFKMILESEPEIEIVGEAEDGLQAVEAARELRPDVVLVDIRMPNLDGLEATRRILDTPGEAPRILMLTTFDLDEYVYEALRAGASGFMVEPGRRAAELLLARVRPDAILCANDLLAVGVLAALRDAGLDVPGQVALVGMDNCELSALTWPALTTVDLGSSERARLAAMTTANRG